MSKVKDEETIMFPKPKRITDRRLLDSYHNKPCVICGKTEGTVAHHVKTRGSAGNDVRDNLRALCVTHHQEVHSQGTLTFAKKYNLE